MTLYEVIKLQVSTIAQLERVNMRPHDSRYIGLYEEFIKRKNKGEKVSYITAVLADNYNISERKVYDIIKRFSSYCNPFAVEKPTK